MRASKSHRAGSHGRVGARGDPARVDAPAGTCAAGAPPDEPAAAAELPAADHRLEEARDGPPFGPAFFLDQLRGMIRDRCPSPGEGLPQVELHLLSGEVLDLCHVIGVTPSWAALAVIEQGPGAAARRMRTELVPFAAIARVTIRTESTEPAHIGFNAEHLPFVVEEDEAPPRTPEAAIRAVRGAGPRPPGRASGVTWTAAGGA